jgi:transposase, IS5 family
VGARTWSISGRGFFDLDDRLGELSAKGGSLERVRVQALVDFEMFRVALEAAVPRADRSKRGSRPSITC